jgi:hypothetical protein
MFASLEQDHQDIHHDEIGDSCEGLEDDTYVKSNNNRISTPRPADQ